MKYKTLILTFAICSIYLISWAQSDSALVYGEIGKDLNKPSKLIKLPGGNLLWAGEWNNDGFIMKISSTGDEIKRLTLSYTPGSTLKLKDMILDKDNTIIVAGECSKCVTTDSMTRVALFRIDTGLSTILQKSLLQGKSLSSPSMYNPTIARNDHTLILQATQAEEGMDYEDIYLASLNDLLDTIWTKSINTCEECQFEYPYRLIGTKNGFTSFAYHNFTDTATIFHFDDTGHIQWRQRTFTYDGVAGGAITAWNGRIYIGVGVLGFPQEPFYYRASILTFDEKTGTALNLTTINDPFTDRAITSLEFARNGYLIVGYRRLVSSFNGSLLTSQVIRLDLLSPSPRFIDSKLIPNPMDNISMGIVQAIALNDDGSMFGSIGIRGTSRTFYFTSQEVTVATNDVSSETNFTISPNPALQNQPLTLHFPTDWLSGKKAKIAIHNINGALIKQINHTPYQSDITVDGLPSGMYIIVLKNGKKMLTNKLLVL